MLPETARPRLSAVRDDLDHRSFVNERADRTAVRCRAAGECSRAQSRDRRQLALEGHDVDDARAPIPGADRRCQIARSSSPEQRPVNFFLRSFSGSGVMVGRKTSMCFLASCSRTTCWCRARQVKNHWGRSRAGRPVLGWLLRPFVMRVSARGFHSMIFAPAA